MNRKEARQVLARELEPFRSLRYADLQRLIADSEHREVTGPSGTKYQLKFHAFWDSGKGGDLRVMGDIDDFHLWSAIFPLCSDFIMAPDGTFVGEGPPKA